MAALLLELEFRKSSENLSELSGLWLADEITGGAVIGQKFRKCFWTLVEEWCCPCVWEQNSTSTIGNPPCNRKVILYINDNDNNDYEKNIIMKMIIAIIKMITTTMIILILILIIEIVTIIIMIIIINK